MTNALALGHQAQLCTDAEGIDTSSEPFEFVSEDVRKIGLHIERAGIRGTRSHDAADVRDGPYSVAGTIVMEPTPAELAIWLPRILGAAADGNTYALAETVPDFVLCIDRISKVFTYTGCKVNRCVFSGSAGGMLQMALEIVGKTEAAVGAAGSFPALTIVEGSSYIFSDVVLTLTSARGIANFDLTIDNHLIADRFLNAVTLAEIPEGDRTITLRAMPAYDTDNTDLYGQAVAGAAGTLIFEIATVYRTTFTFAKLQAPPESPVVGGKGEIMLPLTMIARQSGETKELVVTHESLAV